MKREELENLGLTREQINDIMPLHGRTINKLNNEKLDLQEALTLKEKELKKYELNNIETKTENKPINVDNQKENQLKKESEYEKLIEDLKTKDEYINRYISKIIDLQLDNALQKHNAYNTSTVKPLLKNLKTDDEGNFIDLDIEIEKIKESDPYLFKNEKHNELKHINFGGRSIPSETNPEIERLKKLYGK